MTHNVKHEDSFFFLWIQTNKLHILRWLNNEHAGSTVVLDLLVFNNLNKILLQYFHKYIVHVHGKNRGNLVFLSYSLFHQTNILIYHPFSTLFMGLLYCTYMAQECWILYRKLIVGKKISTVLEMKICLCIFCTCKK